MPADIPHSLSSKCAMKRNSLPWADSNRRHLPVCRTNPTSDSTLPTELHGIPYHYHAQRIFCAIMFNNVAYQAATDGRAFQLIPLILVSIVRSSTSGLLVASDTDVNIKRSSQPLSLTFAAAGIHRPRHQSWLCTNMSKNYFSFHRLRKVRDSNSRSVLPLASLAVRCFRPLSQPSKYIVFYVSSFRKPANLAAGWTIDEIINLQFISLIRIRPLART